MARVKNQKYIYIYISTKYRNQNGNGSNSVFRGNKRFTLESYYAGEYSKLSFHHEENSIPETRLPRLVYIVEFQFSRAILRFNPRSSRILSKTPPPTSTPQKRKKKKQINKIQQLEK